MSARKPGTESPQPKRDFHASRTVAVPNSNYALEAKLLLQFIFIFHSYYTNNFAIYPILHSEDTWFASQQEYNLSRMVSSYYFQANIVMAQ
jgi:hypothetical protein